MRRRQRWMIVLASLVVVLLGTLPRSVSAGRWHVADLVYIGYEQVCADGMKLSLIHRADESFRRGGRLLPITVRLLDALTEDARTIVFSRTLQLEERDVPDPIDPTRTRPFSGEYTVTWMKMLAAGTRVVLSKGGGSDLYLTIGGCRLDGPPAPEYPLHRASANARPAIGGPQEIHATVEVSSRQAIADLNITLQLEHDRTDELELELTSPAGTTIRLVAGLSGVAVGSNPRPRIGYTCREPMIFDDESAAPLQTAVAPFIASAYRPQQSLSVFDGQAAGGTWTLTIRDTQPANNNGVLNCFTLEISESYAVALPYVHR